MTMKLPFFIIRVHTLPFDVASEEIKWNGCKIIYAMCNLHFRTQTDLVNIRRKVIIGFPENDELLRERDPS